MQRKICYPVPQLIIFVFRFFFLKLLFYLLLLNFKKIIEDSKPPSLSLKQHYVLNFSKIFLKKNWFL